MTARQVVRIWLTVGLVTMATVLAWASVNTDGLALHSASRADMETKYTFTGTFTYSYTENGRTFVTNYEATVRRNLEPGEGYCEREYLLPAGQIRGRPGVSALQLQRRSVRRISGRMADVQTGGYPDRRTRIRRGRKQLEQDAQRQTADVPPRRSGRRAGPDQQSSIDPEEFAPTSPNALADTDTRRRSRPSVADPILQSFLAWTTSRFVSALGSRLWPTSRRRVLQAFGIHAIDGVETSREGRRDTRPRGQQSVLRSAV